MYYISLVMLFFHMVEFSVMIMAKISQLAVPWTAVPQTGLVSVEVGSVQHPWMPFHL